MFSMSTGKEYLWIEEGKEREKERKDFKFPQSCCKVENEKRWINYICKIAIFSFTNIF